MIKRIHNYSTLLLLFTLSILSITTPAQNFGNEWVDLSQTYYRFSIPETGMYRVSRQELVNAGVPLSEITSLKNIQLYANGEEIPCYIYNENQENLQYIEFYAEKNDGWFDTAMYVDPTDQVNPHFSMVNDSAAVFLTWNNSYDNLRYEYLSNQSLSGYSSIPYAYFNVLQEYINQSSGNYRSGISPSDCEYQKGEGYFDSERFNVNGSISKTLATPYAYDGLTATASFAYATISSGRYDITVSGPGFTVDSAFTAQRGVKYTETISSSALSDENTFTFSSTEVSGTTTAYTSVSFIEVNYPRQFILDDASTASFTLPANSKRLLELYLFDGGSEAYVFDRTNKQRILLQNVSDVYKCVLKSSNQEAGIFALNADEFLSVGDIKEAPMTNFGALGKETIIISHPKLWEQAQIYAAYRDAELINIQELYDQFGYGIQKHPMAIRNFINYAKTYWSTQPERLFIIGKGVATYLTRFNASAYKQNLIPTMGHPASDILLSSRIQGSTILPTLQTGRLAAVDNEDVANYLEKVQEMESNEVGEWMKRGIHFGGGSTENEQSTFAYYLNRYKKTFSDTLFGGEVSTFLKTSSEPIAISKSDSVSNLINDGVSLLTFFGHGSSNGFDQNIDDPTAYKNKGRYPLMLANSCYTGDIFLTGQTSQSESWVLIDDRGACAFLALIYEGVAGYLDLFSSEFYRQFSKTSYGKTLGECVFNSRQYMSNFSTTGYFKSTIQEFTLHGDPALVLNSFEKPDFFMKEANIGVFPENVTTESDSLKLRIIPLNISRTTNKASTINISRTFGDGSISDTLITLDKLYYKDTLWVSLPMDASRALGTNTFTVILDAYNDIDELNESNNSATIAAYISSTDVLPVIPYAFALVNSTSPTLKLATGDPFAEEQTSVFQIDTSYQFDSPLLNSESLTHSGGIIEWEPNISFSPGQTYYWRAAKSQSNTDDMSWSESSFTLDASEEGWQQNAKGQFLKNDMQYLEYADNSYAMSFNQRPKTLTIKTYGTQAISSYYDIEYDIDGTGDYSSCGTNKMLVVVIDSIALTSWESDYGEFGQSNYPRCASRSRTDLYFVFGNSASGIANLINFVNNDVPEGNYVAIYNAGNGNYENWGEDNWKGFEAWYSNSRVRLLDNGEAYILLFRKGSTAYTIEQTAGIDEENILVEDLYTNFTSGVITTDLIGPALEWSTLTNAVHRSTYSDEDSYLRLYALDRNENATLLYDTIRTNTIDLSGISTSTYPYLQVEFHTTNPTSFKPDQLKNIRVSYTPVSDLAINPARGGTFYADTLLQGEEGLFVVAYENIGYQTLDSMQIQYWIQDHNNETTILKTAQVGGLEPGEYAFDSITWETTGLSSTNTLWVELNARSSLKSDITNLEQNYYNNLAHKSFYVEVDETDPVLDVTFDGVHILDGDIVSATPEIVMQLTDENEYIALSDTSLFSLYLDNGGEDEELIALTGNPQVTFIPADLPKNKAQLIYTPEFSEDGVYQLRVQAKDASGNESGSLDYQISFEVINESTITNVFNYPNPFSSSTRFVFELTGSVLPDEFRIDILTVSGKVVKVIYLEDLGPINIGRNITQYAWDGRDDFGDLLANGVYFYRVYARVNGQEMTIRNTGTSQFFKNGFGKMYLLR